MFLLPATKLQQGNVFTPVHRGVSVHGVLCLGGGGFSVPGESLSGRPPYNNVQAVHILLECILGTPVIPSAHRGKVMKGHHGTNTIEVW